METLARHSRYAAKWMRRWLDAFPDATLDDVAFAVSALRELGGPKKRLDEGHGSRVQCPGGLGIRVVVSSLSVRIASPVRLYATVALREFGSRRFVGNVNVSAYLDDEVLGRFGVSEVRSCDLFGVSVRGDR